MITESLKLQKMIDELGSLLMQGHRLKMESFIEYNSQKTNPKFDIDSFVSKWQKDFTNFEGSILYNIQVLLGTFHHYLFHVLNPEPVILSKSNWHPKYSKMFNTFSAKLKALEDIVYRLEDQFSLALKSEIVKQETDQNIKYRITFSDHTRVIRLNGIDMSKPDFDGLSHKFFNYIYNRAGEVVKIADFEAEEKVTFGGNRRPVQVLADIGFTGKLKEIFFPVCTKTEVKFVNPITNKYAEEQGLPSISDKDLSGRVRQSKKESDSV